MIHFDFIVDDIDAENIMSCLHQMRINRHSLILDLVVDNGGKEEGIEDQIKSLEESIQYYHDLQMKMTNTRVEE